MSVYSYKYDEIMRHYTQLRLKDQREQSKRQEEVYRKLPQVKEINSLIASLSIAQGKKLLGGDSDALQSLKNSIKELTKEKNAILTSAGYSSDYLAVHYECPICKDTGYISDTQRCSCFKKLIVESLYDMSNIKNILSKENFSSFNLSLFSDSIYDNLTNQTPRTNMQKAYSYCVDYVDQFDSSYTNILLYGETGVGKTFLTHCIAKALLDTSHSVIYLSAIKIFEILADATFGHSSEASASITRLLYDCDLLIIDDLGTEVTNSFTSSALFNCINERHLKNKSTIISTNLTMNDITKKYSERITSRFTSDYDIIRIFGEDLRIQSKLVSTQ